MKVEQALNSQNKRPLTYEEKNVKGRKSFWENTSGPLGNPHKNTHSGKKVQKSLERGKGNRKDGGVLNRS